MRRGSLLLMIPMVLAPPIVAITGAARYHAANRSTNSMTSGGQRRDYSLHVPRTVNRNQAVPLVISMHGAGLWPAAQMMITGWNAVADSVGAIVVYPSGLPGGGPTVWSTSDRPATTADVRYIADLIDTLSAVYRIDPARIYAEGLSNGGGMAFILSCALSRRVAAVGMVAPAHLRPMGWCADSTPVPMLHIHGTDDTTVPYDGGTSWVTSHSFPAVRSWVASWARRNRCDPVARDSSLSASVVRRSYQRCTGGATVELLTIRGGGHTWPGGTTLPAWFVGRTSTEVDASRELWRFFSRHSR